MKLSQKIVLIPTVWGKNYAYVNNSRTSVREDLKYVLSREELTEIVNKAVEYGLNSFPEFDANSNYGKESAEEGLKQIQKDYISKIL